MGRTYVSLEDKIYNEKAHFRKRLYQNKTILNTKYAKKNQLLKQFANIKFELPNKNKKKESNSRRITIDDVK